MEENDGLLVSQSKFTGDDALDAICIDANDIENELEYYEKVSLVFLLYDNPSVALEYLMLVEKGAHKELIKEWIHHTKTNWKAVLLEALTIMQCFAVLHKLGIDKEDVERYRNKFIHPTKRRLYKICEDLGQSDTTKFIKYIKEDMKSKRTPSDKMHFNMNNKYLELYFLHLFATQYIQLDNIENIEKALRNIKDDMNYHINKENVGICLIINEEDFYTEPGHQSCKSPDAKLQKRIGTDKDKEALIKTFSKHGFQIIVKDNINNVQIMETIYDITQSKFQREHSCLFVIILSHGYEGHIYGNNSLAVSISSIKTALCDRSAINLYGKPKVLILQSCQGTKSQELIQTDGNLPQRADLLVGWSTIPGFASMRHINEGSWYIQSLCQRMMAYSCRHHFEDILSLVNKDVSDKQHVSDGKILSMLSMKDSTFRKFLFLPIFDRN